MTIGEKYEETIIELKKACKAKTAVPVDQVYPLFINLTILWNSWTNELYFLAFRRGILIKLNQHLNSFDTEVTEQLLVASEIYSKDIEPEILAGKSLFQ